MTIVPVGHHETLSGKSETFIVQTCRFEDQGGDFIFVQCVDESGVIRLALPPKVANAIEGQLYLTEEVGPDLLGSEYSHDVLDGGGFGEQAEVDQAPTHAVEFRDQVGF